MKIKRGPEEATAKEDKNLISSFLIKFLLPLFRSKRLSSIITLIYIPWALAVGAKALNIIELPEVAGVADDVWIPLILFIFNACQRVFQEFERQAQEKAESSVKEQIKDLKYSIEHTGEVTRCCLETLKLEGIIDDPQPANSLRHAIAAWNRVIKKSSPDGSASTLRDCWAKIMETYFREEAYDISRKEIVTNARNFPFLLLGITRVLIEQAKNAGKKVHYCAFTPVEPKNWPNWPHGDFKPRAYYEQWFIGTFYRALSAFIGENDKHLVHHRFVLCKEGEDAEKNRSTLIGRLETENTIDTDLRSWRIWPCPIPIENRRADDVLRTRFQPNGQATNEDGSGYFQVLCSQLIDYKVALRSDEEFHYFIPMNNNQDIKRKHDRDDEESLITEWNQWKQITEISDSIISKWQNFHQNNYDNIKNKIITKLEKASQYKPHAEELFRLLEENKVCDSILAIQNLDIKTAEIEQDLDLWRLISLYLIKRDAEGVVQNPMLLREWFKTKLHSCTNKEKQHYSAYLLPLKKNQIDHWANARIGKEFAIWGVEESEKEVNWHTMLSSELADPFTTTRLQFNHEKNEGSPLWIASGIANQLLEYENREFIRIVHGVDYSNRLSNLSSLIAKRI